MNAVLESLIARINQDEFSDTEIVIISNTDNFNDDDLQKLEEAVKSNEWVKNNLVVVQLHPNTFSRPFYVADLKHQINFVSVRTKENLVDIIHKLKSGTFYYSSISFFQDFETNDTKFSDEDLDSLVLAINASEWCQNYLKKLHIRAYNTRLPAIKCQNLQELDISRNPLSEIAELDCPNLLHVNAMSIGKFDSNAFKGCLKLKQIDAFSSNLRVPPNIMPYQNFKSLNVLHNSPLSPLGVYALLLMQQRMKFKIDPNQGDFAAKFATVYQLDPDFRMPELFVQYPLYGQPKLAEDIVNAYIDQFKIPEHFFEDQINRILSFMSKIYNHCTPVKIHQSVESQLLSDTLVKIKRPVESQLYPDAKLKELNQDYQGIRGLLFSTIDGLLERGSKTPAVNHSDLLDVVKERISENLTKLDDHNHFFRAELDFDFAMLIKIFNAVDKPQHAQAISNYIANNSSRWPQLLNARTMLFLEAKTHIKERLAKRINVVEASPPSASPTFEVKRLKEDEPLLRQTENSRCRRCVIS